MIENETNLLSEVPEDPDFYLICIMIKGQGMNYVELCQKIGISTSTMYKWQSGDRRPQHRVSARLINIALKMLTLNQLIMCRVIPRDSF